MNKICTKDFLPGDILLFKVDVSNPNTEWISKAIAFLTNSDVSHAALYLGENLLSDEGLSGLACHKITDDSADDPAARPTYVRRLETPIDKGPVLNSAKQYIKNNEPYDTPALVLLGLILLYRKFPIHLLPVDFVTKVLAIAAAKIDEYIASRLHPGKKPMVCSQYVFQCYEDGGADYQLQLALRNALPENSYTLIDHVHKIVSSAPDQWDSQLQAAITPTDAYDEKYMSELVEKMKTIDFSQAMPASAVLDKEIIQSVLHFSSKVYTLFHQDETALTTVEKLSINTDKKALFVTPADLKLCTNLNDIGDAILYRDDEVTEIE